MSAKSTRRRRDRRTRRSRTSRPSDASPRGDPHSPTAQHRLDAALATLQITPARRTATRGRRGSAGPSSTGGRSSRPPRPTSPSTCRSATRPAPRRRRFAWQSCSRPGGWRRSRRARRAAYASTAASGASTASSSSTHGWSTVIAPDSSTSAHGRRLIRRRSTFASRPPAVRSRAAPLPGGPVATLSTGQVYLRSAAAKCQPACTARPYLDEQAYSLLRMTREQTRDVCTSDPIVRPAASI